jgi:hypothetical protein
LLKDDDVDCGGKRGDVVKLLDSGGRVLPDGLDEKSVLENESEVVGCCAKVIPIPKYSINKE